MSGTVVPGRSRPDVLSAAWDVLAARDEVSAAGEQFDGLTRRRQRLDWDVFTAWRDDIYAPAHASLATAVATFTVLVGRVNGDAVTVAERIVAVDIDTAVPGTRGSAVLRGRCGSK